MASGQVIDLPAADMAPAFAVCSPDLRQGRTVGDVLAGTQGFRFEIDGAPVLDWAARPIGSELWVDAMAGDHAGGGLTEAADVLLIEQARAAGLLSIAGQTRRRGLVRRALKLGYRIDGYILRKEIQ